MRGRPGALFIQLLFVLCVLMPPPPASHPIPSHPPWCSTLQVMAEGGSADLIADLERQVASRTAMRGTWEARSAAEAAEAMAADAVANAADDSADTAEEEQKHGLIDHIVCLGLVAVFFISVLSDASIRYFVVYLVFMCVGLETGVLTKASTR